jgi:replication factor C small subunit
MEEIWTEKYRPRKLKDIAGQDNITKALASFVQNRNLPHCLFAGPAGCGKTTAALCIANELYGSSIKGNFLELNASDERGIDVIREKVKDFARQQTAFGSGMFRIVYLDEADALTKDAQHALRRTMENYSHVCRFILACNYSGKIIHPIQSRTAVFRFSVLKEEDMTEALRGIAKKEKLDVEDEAYHAIIKVAEGDLRKATNILQLAATHKHITEEIVYTVTNRADPHAVRKMIETSVAGKFREARSQLLALLNERGLAGEDIIKEIHSQIFDLDISELQKLQMIEKVGEYEFRMTEGSNPHVQLEAMLAQFALIGKK